MKKILSLLLSLSLLSACSWFSKDDPDAPSAEEFTNFEAVMTKMHKSFTEDIVSSFPEYEVPLKNNTSFLLAGTLTPSQEDVVGLDQLTFNITVDGNNDFTDENNPQGQSTMQLNAEVTGNEPGSGFAEIIFKVVDQQFFLSLQKLVANANGEQVPVELFANEYLGKWFSLDFEGLNGYIADSAKTEGFRIQNSFQNPNIILQQTKKRFQNAINKIHLWKLKKVLPVENGMYKYEVELNQEVLKNGVLALAEFFYTNPDGTVRREEFEQTKVRVEEEFSEDVIAQGVLSVDMQNFQYFDFVGTLAGNNEMGDITMSRTAEKMQLLFDPKGASQRESIAFAKEGVEYSLSVGDASVLNGIWAEQKKSGTLHDVSGAQVMNFEFEKTGERSYTGTILTPEGDSKILVPNFSYSDDSLHLELSILENDTLVFEGQAEYQFKEIDSVQVEIPTESQPLEEALQGIVEGFSTSIAPSGHAEWETFDLPEYEGEIDEDAPAVESLEALQSAE